MEKICLLSQHCRDADRSLIFKSPALFGINCFCCPKSYSSRYTSTTKDFPYFTHPVVDEFIVCFAGDLGTLERGSFSMVTNTQDQTTLIIITGLFCRRNEF